MTNFLNLRLPEELCLGAVGGPEYSTDIVIASSGYEQRNINWIQARAKYNLAPAINTQEQLQELIAFFRLCKGRAVGFRFKDFSDYTAQNQLIGIGDGVQKDFQLVKEYHAEIKSEKREITKPVEGTVIVLVNDQGVNYICNHDTGTIHFETPPEVGHKIAASFEFDIPVRFDTDQLFASLDTYKSSWKEIPIIEIRV